VGSTPYPPSQLHFPFEEYGRSHLHLVICSVIFISVVCFHSSSFVIITGHLTFTILRRHRFTKFYNFFFTYFLGGAPCLTSI
jgi:hypothetical protein